MATRPFTPAPQRCFAIWPSHAPTAVCAVCWRGLSRIDVLVIDDWAMAPLAEPERRDFWEICEDRYQTRSTILTSQLPVTRWHEQIGDPTAADGILDRLVHNAHRIEMRGDSMRKNRGKVEHLAVGHAAGQSTSSTVTGRLLQTQPHPADNSRPYPYLTKKHLSRNHSCHRSNSRFHC